MPALSTVGKMEQCILFGLFKIGFLSHERDLMSIVCVTSLLTRHSTLGEIHVKQYFQMIASSCSALSFPHLSFENTRKLNAFQCYGGQQMSSVKCQIVSGFQLCESHVISVVCFCLFCNPGNNVKTMD